MIFIKNRFCTFDDQKGFGLVPVLLILLLVTAVGATGYYVYGQQSNKNTNSSEVAGNSSVKTTPTPSPTASVTPTPKAQTDTQKYLVIKEWDVKIPLSENISDATYKIDGEEVKLTRKYITDINPGCDWVYKIGRTTTEPKHDSSGVVTNKEGMYNGTYLAQIGSYYFTGFETQASCTDDKYTLADTTQQKYAQIQLDARNTFIIFAKKIEENN